jgi:hypothetical protein
LRSGKRSWIGFLIAFAILAGTQFMEGTTNHSVAFIIYIAAASTIFFLLRALQFGRKLKQHPDLTMALNDEYIQHIRLKSYRITYWVVCLIIVSLLFLKDVFSLSADSVILIIFLAAIFTPHIILLILDRGK